MKALSMLAGSALFLAACSGGDDEMDMTARTISDINVTSDVQSIGNADAVAYWQTLPSDLETALAAELVDSISAEGAVMTVDVDEISLADAFSSGFAGAGSQLRGRVVLTDPNNENLLGTYDVVATASQAASYLPASEGTVTISPTSTEFYAAVVRAFASGVATTVRAGGVSAS